MSSYYAVRQGKRVDRDLWRAFEESVEGPGDGRVSAGNVREKVAPRLADGGTMTGPEGATVELAMERFRFTKAGKRELSKTITETAGKPVFAWQREADVVSVQNGGKTPLTTKQLLAKAQDFVLHNVEPVPGAERAYPHLDDGNNGTFPYLVQGDKAKTIVELYKALGQDPAPSITFDPARHAVLLVQDTWDESGSYVSVIDRATGEVTPPKHMNWVDIGYLTTEEKFVRVMGPLSKWVEPSEDDDGKKTYSWEDIDGWKVYEWIEKGAKAIPVFNRQNESHPLHDAWSGIGEVASAIEDGLWKLERDGTQTELGIDKLPVVEDLRGMVKAMFIAGIENDSDARVLKQFAPDITEELADDRALNDMTSVFTAGLKVSAAQKAELRKKFERLADALGDRPNLRAFHMEAKVGLREGGSARAKGVVLVDVENGFYARVYSRA